MKTAYKTKSFCKLALKMTAMLSAVISLFPTTAEAGKCQQNCVVWRSGSNPLWKNANCTNVDTAADCSAICYGANQPPINGCAISESGVWHRGQLMCYYSAAATCQ
jgi:hypothetical protein